MRGFILVALCMVLPAQALTLSEGAYSNSERSCSFEVFKDFFSQSETADLVSYNRLEFGESLLRVNLKTKQVRWVLPECKEHVSLLSVSKLKGDLELWKASCGKRYKSKWYIKALLTVDAKSGNLEKVDFITERIKSSKIETIESIRCEKLSAMK